MVSKGALFSGSYGVFLVVAGSFVNYQLHSRIPFLQVVSAVLVLYAMQG